MILRRLMDTVPRFQNALRPTRWSKPYLMRNILVDDEFAAIQLHFLLPWRRSVGSSTTQSSPAPVKLDCNCGFPLVLVTTDVRSVICKAYGLEFC